MDIMGKMKAQQQEKTEAIKEAKEAAEAKASEYAALSARVDRLERTIGSLERTIGGLETSLQGITPQKIESVQKAGEKVFEPLKQTAADLNIEIKAAGNQATKAVKEAAVEAGEAVRAAAAKIRETEYSTINLTGRAIYALLTAIFFCAIQYGIQYHFTPSEDYAKRILWNIQYRGENGENTVNFFESEESAKAKYDNQKRYEDIQKLKAQQEAAKNQK